MIALVAITTPFLILSIAFQGVVAPLATLGSLVIGVVYTVVLLVILKQTPLWPKWDSTGTWWVACALLWGAAVSYAVAAMVGYPATDMALTFRMEDAIASFGGAWPEEAAKGLGVLFVLMAFKRFNRPWHGFAVGMVVGLGFEAAENAMYGSLLALFHPSYDLVGMLQSWGVRSIFLPFLHIAWTGAVGWAIGLALYTANRSLGWRLQVIGVYFVYAFACHFTWNYFIDSNAVFIAKNIVVGILMYAVWIYVWIRAWRGATNDQTYVATSHPLTRIDQLPVPARDVGSPVESDLGHIKTS